MEFMSFYVSVVYPVMHRKWSQKTNDCRFFEIVQNKVNFMNIIRNNIYWYCTMTLFTIICISFLMKKLIPHPSLLHVTSGNHMLAVSILYVLFNFKIDLQIWFLFPISKIKAKKQ